MLEDVRKIFLRVANNRDGVAVPDCDNMRFRISGTLYGTMLNLHREARIMVDQLERVLNDGEHRLMIEEGQALKMRMPDTDSFRLRIEAMRAHLDSYDLNHVVRLSDDRYDIPVHTARNLHTTALLTTSFVYDFFYAILATDYMKNIRRLKSSGTTYAGPLCVQEAFMPCVTLTDLVSFLKMEAMPVRLPANWMRKPYPPQRDPEPATS